MISRPGIRNAMRVTFLALVLGVAVAPLPVWAHDSPEHVVEMLTVRMQAVGRKPELLWRRATEYRALMKLPEAERDLREATRRRRDYMPALLDLCRVQLARNQNLAALKTIERARSLEKPGHSDPGVQMLHAEVFGALGQLPQAVAQCDQALARQEVTNPEWYLVRCQLQYRLGHYREAAEGLREGLEKTGNAVLEAEWIDAAIDAGQNEEALRHVAAQIGQFRCQASWLIRRGRANAGLGRISESQSDLLAAVTELNGRLGKTRGDFTLLSERGLAYALLGDRELALNDLGRARALGADSWALRRLEESLNVQ